MVTVRAPKPAADKPAEEVTPKPTEETAPKDVVSRKELPTDLEKAVELDDVNPFRRAGTVPTYPQVYHDAVEAAYQATVNNQGKPKTRLYPAKSLAEAKGVLRALKYLATHKGYSFRGEVKPELSLPNGKTYTNAVVYVVRPKQTKKAR